jgi:hypothetical protein
MDNESIYTPEFFIDNPVLNQTHNALAIKLQRMLGKLYIFFLSFRMIAPLMFTQKYVGACARDFDFVLHLIGLTLIVVGGRERINRGSEEQKKLLRFFIGMIIWFDLSSLAMATIIQIKYGSIGTDNALGAVFFVAIYFLQYTFMIIYNREIFMLISADEIISIIGKSTFVLLLIGYWQTAVLNSGGALDVIYDKLDFLNVLLDSKLMSKLSLTGTEGASAGTIICVFIIPYYYALILSGKRVFRSFITILLWLPVLYFTYSTTAYILFSVASLIFFILYLFSKKHIIIKLLFITIFAILFMGLLIPDTFLSILPDETSEEINYLLLEKATDFNNGSTVSRTVPIYMNLGAFSKYPIMGVGNGCQGYFYEEFFPSWAYDVKGSDVLVFLKISQNGISNAGVFTMSILSGYGIIGTVLFFIYFIKSYKIVFKLKEQQSTIFFLYLCMMAWPLILISGLQGSFEGSYMIWFLLSLQFLPIDMNIKPGVEFKDEIADKRIDTDDEQTGYIETNSRKLFGS